MKWRKSVEAARQWMVLDARQSVAWQIKALSINLRVSINMRNRKLIIDNEVTQFSSKLPYYVNVDINVANVRPQYLGTGGIFGMSVRMRYAGASGWVRRKFGGKWYQCVRNGRYGSIALEAYQIKNTRHDSNINQSNVK
jgi:hypothetical protein